MSQIDRDLVGETQEDQVEELPPVPEGWQREVRCPITGIRVVNARPGGRKITSEDVRRLMEEEDSLDEEDEEDEEDRP
jgi:hypothetical protein